MTKPTLDPETRYEPDAWPARASGSAYPGTPRWVKVAGIAALVLVLLVVAIMFVGGGEHGPGRHTPASSGITYTPAVAIAVQESR